LRKIRPGYVSRDA